MSSYGATAFPNRAYFNTEYFLTAAPKFLWESSVWDCQYNFKDDYITLV